MTGPRVLALLPGLAGPGGIQRHNRLLCTALSRYLAERDGELSVVSLRDEPGWRDAYSGAPSVVGCAEDKYRFGGRCAAAIARGYDLLIVGVVDFGPLALPAKIARPRRPILTSTYGIEVWGRMPPHHKVALQVADRCLTISDATGQHLTADHGVRPERITVIPPPMDPDFLERIERWQAGAHQARRTRLLSIARMNRIDREKGIDDVLRALPELRRRHPDVDYTVIGDGDDRPALQDLAADLGVGDIVRFEHGVDDDDLQAYLAGCDVFVLPSAKEGFGIVYLEAGAHRKPVVGGAHKGALEVIESGETGLLVSRGDVGALVDALDALLSDPGRRAALGAGGLERIHTRYAYSRFEEDVHGLVDAMLAGRAAS